jgi:multisubunit Na+/H+ antiporter MnhE subunit
MKVIHFTLLLLYYLKEIVWSGLWTSKLILSRQESLTHDGIFTFETRLRKSRQIIFLFNLISMTPGTLSVDLYKDNRLLDIHILDRAEEENTRRSIAKLEKLVQKGL